MTKLIIQIPCYNEADTLSETLRDLPGSIEGIDTIEVLVVDDGSTDRTVEVAKSLGVPHIVRQGVHTGLARAFKAGINASLKLGADIIVNTDGDNQYDGRDVEKLVRPVLEGAADIVIGTRPIQAIEHFSFFKKKLQTLGSWVVRKFSNTTIPDVTSGFRAFSRDAALRMNIHSVYSYTIETIIEAGSKNMAITSVPIRVNEKTRESRLIRSLFSYLYNSTLTIFRVYILYRPLRALFYAGGTITLIGLVLVARYFYYYLFSETAAHVQSLIIAAILIITGVQIFVMGLIADIISTNRLLMEEILYMQKKASLSEEKPANHMREAQ